MKTPLLILSLCLLLSCKTEQANQQAGMFQVPAAFLPATQAFQIDPNKDTLLQLTAKGTVLHIPKNSFVDAKGNTVTNKVEINFKEYRNAADMAFSGIPMTYTKGGEELNFDSAGMFEINGRSEGKEIAIAPDKSLSIDYHLAKKNDSIDFYRLKKDQSNWELVSNIEPEVIEIPSDNAMNNLVKPIKAEENDDRIIAIAFEDRKMLPELQQFHNVKFRVADKSDFDSKELEGIWYDVDLKKTKTPGEYQVFFWGTNRNFEGVQVSYFVNPVYEGSDYDKALAAYEKKFAQIDSIRILEREKAIAISKEQRKEEIRQAEEQRKENERWLAEQKRIQDQWNEDQKQYQEKMAEERKKQNEEFQKIIQANQTYNGIVSNLSIRGFGVYNCDGIYRVPKTISISASYIDENQQPIVGPRLVSMIDLRYNGAFSFPANNFRCGTEGEIVLLLFADNNKLYLLDKGKFQEMNLTKNCSATFQMKEVSDKIKNTADLAQHLGLPLP